MQNITQRAITAVGNDGPDDGRLDPKAHAKALGSDAEQLKEILLSAAIAEIVDDFDIADPEAGGSQRTYKALARLTAWTGFGAIVIGSLGLMSLLSFLPGLALTVAWVIQASLLLVSFSASLLIGTLKPFETWMVERAKAENARSRLFNHVMDVKRETAPGTLPLLPLQLEYFRRYHLDVQQNYYRVRGGEHAAAARAAWWWRLFVLILIVLAALPIVWTIQGSPWLPSFLKETEMVQRVFLGFGTIAAALQGLLASHAVMSLNERNAVRYRSTAENLEALAGRPLEEARAAAAVSGNDDDDVTRHKVLGFVALVQDQISSEHREWIALREVAPDLALDRLTDLRLWPR